MLLTVAVIFFAGALWASILSMLFIQFNTVRWTMLYLVTSGLVIALFFSWSMNELTEYVQAYAHASSSGG